METDQIKEVMARANDVINGFRNPNNQTARDVIKLANELLATRRMLAAQSFKNAGGSDSADFLKSIFK